MRFTNYLAEGRSEKSTLDDVAHLLNSRCSKSYDAYLSRRAVIYRGLGSVDDDYMTVAPSSSVRKSAHVGSNYYTLLMDNLPAWKKYPARSRSIVCSTDPFKAMNYSTSMRIEDLYVVFPQNNASIGVCSDDDIFGSFYLGLGLQLGSWSHDIEDAGLDDSSWAALKRSAKKFDERVSAPDFPSMYDGSRKEMALLYGRGKTKEFYKGDILKALNKSMAPQLNDFHLQKSGDKLPLNREVWTDGFSVMILKKHMEEVDQYIQRKKNDGEL